MQLSNLSLAYLVLELKPVLEGALLRKVQQLKHKGFKFKLQTRQGTKDLVLTGDAFFLSSHLFPVEEKPWNFTLRLRKLLLNKKLLSVKQAGFERIVFFEFETATLCLEMFHNGNLILLGKDNEIIDLLTNQEFASRILRKKEKYVLPPSRGLDPSSLDEKKLHELFLSSDKDSFHALVSNVNIAPEIAEEVFFQTKLDKAQLAKKVSLTDAKKIAGKVKDFYALSAEKLSPVKSGKSVFPFSLSFAKDQVPLESLNFFLDELYSQEFTQALGEQAVGETGTEKKKLESKKLQQETALRELSIANESSALSGQKIYEHYEELQALLEAVNSLQKQKKSESEIKEFVKELAGEKWHSKISKIDLKKKEIELEL